MIEHNRSTRWELTFVKAVYSGEVIDSRDDKALNSNVRI